MDKNTSHDLEPGYLTYPELRKYIKKASEQARLLKIASNAAAAKKVEHNKKEKKCASIAQGAWCIRTENQRAVTRVQLIRAGTEPPDCD